MDEDDAKKWTKFILSTVKTVSSALIDIKLSQQEEIAQKERRFDELVLIRVGQNIKKYAEPAVDNWIANL